MCLLVFVSWQALACIEVVFSAKFEDHLLVTTQATEAQS